MDALRAFEPLVLGFFLGVGVFFFFM
jgi:hypothetical protein